MRLVRTRYQIFLTRTRMIHTRRALYEAKQRCGVVSRAILLVTGVHADPTYSYTYDIICIYVRIVTFDFSLKYFIF